MTADRISYARSIVSQEAQALLAATNLIADQFSRAVDLILSITSTGNVIVSGMGKAGLIGNKISATLASTGVPSFFLHPAEAVHGDLGRISAKDLALVLSNSGETDEVVRLLPALKEIGCPIIAITGRPQSSLARHSEVVLSTGVTGEAGPNALAPTTSTTVMLALGDALAMTVQRERGFTPAQFAFYHPAGELGRSLLLVSQVMRSGEELCVVRESDSAKQVLHTITLTKGRPGAAAIVGSNGKLVGIFTDGDLRRCLDQSENFLAEPISKVMGRSPKSVLPQQLAHEALRLMREHHIDQVLVVDQESKPVGLLDIQDLAGL